ncbi:MAG: sialidase family protein [Proteobacteria bacterium]|nr:sialidase family protein [Pseudomonadota bacterium]MDA0995050.1 sialidase family protein [Pseudomonadota bacterium]
MKNIPIKTRVVLVFGLLGVSVIGGCDHAQVASPTVALLATPAAPGSMGPNLIAGADGTIVLSWIEPLAEGHALRHSSLIEGAWSSPGLVASGDNWFVNWADFPSVVPVSDALWAAHWLESQAAGGYAYDVRTAVSKDSGLTWSESIIPHSDNTPTEHGFVTIFADDDGVGLLWLDGRKMVNEYDDSNKRASGMTLRSARINDDQSLSNENLIDDLTCDCCQTDAAVTSEGPVAIYRDRTEGEIRDIYVSRRVDGEWQTGVAVANDNWDIAACPVNGPVIQADGSNVAVAWFSAANDTPRVQIAWSVDAGRTFSRPEEVTAGTPLGHIGLALLSNGDVVVSWLRSTGNGGAELLLKRASRDGGFSADYVVAEAAAVFAFSVPQLAAHGSNLVAAWTAEKDRVYSVQSAIIPLSRLD